jgi:hypothetical protein
LHCAEALLQDPERKKKNEIILMSTNEQNKSMEMKNGNQQQNGVPIAPTKPRNQNLKPRLEDVSTMKKDRGEPQKSKTPDNVVSNISEVTLLQQETLNHE